MKATYLALLSCAAAALFEGAAAGPAVKARLRSLRMPRFSPPFPLWIVIGIAYYFICFLTLRAILLSPPTQLRSLAISLMVAVLFLNGLWNLLFFRKKDLKAAFLLGAAYSLVALLLLGLVSRLDSSAALVFSPYAAYLAYANLWGYRLWRLNRGVNANEATAPS